MRATKVKVGGMLNGFGLELKVESRVFKNRSGLAVNGLTKTLKRTVYLQGIWFSSLDHNALLSTIVL
jgi:hypothetical protein